MTDIQALLTMAGHDYSWPAGGYRPTSSARSGLFAFLKDYADSKCAFCGVHDEHGEACHLVSGGPKRKGYVAGNLAYGCRDCNELDADNGKVIAQETIKFPKLIPTVWPSIPELTAQGELLKLESNMRKENKRAIRGM